MKDPEQQNEYAILLTKKAYIPDPLAIGNTYTIQAEGDIISSTETDNDNGTHLLVYKFVPHTISVIDDKGKKVDARFKSTRSQQLRRALWKLWQIAGEGISEEDFYDREMVKILSNVEKEIYG